GLGNGIVDLRTADAGDEASAWLTRPVLFRSIGAMAMTEQFSDATLAAEYDAIVYLETTTATRPIGARSD
ncbi:MAG: erythromycin esterase family protein, partial [Planctomycetota bacterium]|nr:erythromycin esterase family protein [Planctomycetota bacterium]